MSACGHPSGIVLDGASLGVSVHVDGLSVDDLRTLAHALGRKADELTPAHADAIRGISAPLSVINDVRGSSWTTEKVAAACGIDLSEATEADVSVMAAYIGGRVMGGAA